MGPGGDGGVAMGSMMEEESGSMGLEKLKGKAGGMCGGAGLLEL